MPYMSWITIVRRSGNDSPDFLGKGQRQICSEELSLAL